MKIKLFAVGAILASISMGVFATELTTEVIEDVVVVEVNGVVCVVTSNFYSDTGANLCVSRGRQTHTIVSLFRAHKTSPANITTVK